MDPNAALELLTYYIVTNDEEARHAATELYNWLEKGGAMPSNEKLAQFEAGWGMPCDERGDFMHILRQIALDEYESEEEN